MATDSYGDVLLLVDKIRQQITRSPGLGNGPFSYEALDVIADALFKATQLPGPNVPENSIGELKDIYTIARHVGIPGMRIDSFIKCAAMAGYILVRATASNGSDATNEGQK